MKQPSVLQRAYWEKQLKRYGLTEEAGQSKWLDYGHSVMDRDFDGRIAFRPTTEGPEDEWPVSLC